MKKSATPLAATLLSVIAVAGAHAAVPARLLGDAVSPSAAQRTVVITPETRRVTVTQGETVRFEAQGQDFAFDFNGLPERSIDLAAIAPSGALDHRVTVYIVPDPVLNH